MQTKSGFWGNILSSYADIGGMHDAIRALHPDHANPPEQFLAEPPEARHGRTRERLPREPRDGGLCHRGRHPRGGHRPSGHRRSLPDVRRFGERNYDRLQYDGLGRPNRHGYQPHLCDGDGNRGSSWARGARLPDHERLQARLTIAAISAAFISLFCILFLLSGSAIAQADLRVEKVVFQSNSVSYNEGVPEGVNGYLSWKANYPNTTADWGIIVHDEFFELSAIDISLIAGRENWMILTFDDLPLNHSFAYFASEPQENNSIQIALGTGADATYSSCKVIILPSVDESFECGSPGFPKLDSLTQETVAEYPSEMSLQLRHPATSSDILLDNISYEYQVSVVALVEIWSDLSINATTTDSNGIVRAWANTTDWTENLVTTNRFRARAYDNLTHERSEWSCILQTQIGSLQLGPYSCIGQTDSLVPGLSGDPTMPLSDIPGFAAGMGLSEVAVGAMLGGIFIIGITAFSFFLGGIVGAMIAFTASLYWLYTLNIMPTWGLVVIFVIAMAIIAGIFSGKSGASE